MCNYMLPEYKPTKYEKALMAIASCCYDIAWYTTSLLYAILHGLASGFKDSIQDTKDRAPY
jgi:hypothetical protein